MKNIIISLLFFASLAHAQNMVLKPEISQRGQKPATWQLDLNGLSREQAQQAAGKLSTRLYGKAEGDLHAPLIIKSNFAASQIFGFHVAAVSSGGASLEARLNGKNIFGKSWPRAAATHRVQTLYYFEVPAGAAQIELQVADAGGVVVLEALHFSDSIEHLPKNITLQKASIETNAPPEKTAALVPPNPQPAVGTRFDGYYGIWYYNQAQDDEFKYKYSGGFATYPQQHMPLAIYAKAANKTFFCYGGRLKEKNQVVNMVSYFDHATGQVPRPVALAARATDDAHFNPTLGMDDKGHIYVVCNVHGQGHEGVIYRSDAPYSIDKWTPVVKENFSYSQMWNAPGQGLLWLHTRYQSGRRRLFYVTSADGQKWSDPQMLAFIEQGNYQISGAQGSRVVTAFDFHPQQGGLNARTNIYFLQTRDFGKTWQNVAGQNIALPLQNKENAALVRDYQKENLLVYLKDINFDAAGNPVILYLTTGGYKSGPQSGARLWHTARWTGEKWEFRQVAASDHNYDHGSLYIENENGAELWRVIAPTAPGAQAGGTGGDIVEYISRNQGQTWTASAPWKIPGGVNQTYIRRPANAHDNFYAFWADGNPFMLSPSKIYFSHKSGRVFQLPETTNGDFARPLEIKP